MNRQATRFWTFSTLVGAFLDLFVAYFLLCASTIALFAVKFLGFFGLSLPTPSDYRSLLVDYPTHKVSAVQFSAMRKFPFDSIFFDRNPLKDDLNLNKGDGNVDGFMELEGEASCSSRSDARKLVRDERGFDLKGKGSSNYRLSGGGGGAGCRRRRKGSFDSGKRSSVSSSSNWVTCVDQQSNNDGGGPELSSVLSDFSNFNYEAETPMVVKSVSRYHDEPNEGQPVNEDDKYKMIVSLTRELEESQAARAALYVELEKERSAAASAADEAMSMILRLQEEKASVKMESRQYQRMIEEKSAYDEEEMNILKEIVFRREREKHFLEKQVEEYRQMIHVQNHQDSIQDPRLTFQDFDVSKQEEPEKTIASAGEETSLEIKHGDASSDKSKSGLRRNFTSALDSERTRLDAEVEWLRERLRIVQQGRGKLGLSVEKESLQLQLLEDIARQLQEMTACQASLPLPSSKVGMKKKRRCRSVSLGHAKSS